MKIRNLAKQYQTEKDNLCGLILILRYQYKDDTWNAFERRLKEWIKFGNKEVNLIM